MTDKYKAVVKAIKHLAGRAVSAREVSRIAGLTTAETSQKLQDLFVKGLVKKIKITSPTKGCLWKYDGGDKE